MRAIRDTNPDRYIQLTNGPWAGDKATATLMTLEATLERGIHRKCDVIATNASVSRLRSYCKREFPDIPVFG